MKVPRLRAAVQAAALAAFFLLLFFASGAAPGREVPPDTLLRFDPLAATATAIAARSLAPLFWPGLLVAASALLLGRAFCGWLCPLGATLDAARGFLRRRPGRNSLAPHARLVKYGVLAAVLAAAALSVSLVFLAAPLSLAGRFYGLAVRPALLLAGDTVLRLVRPLAEAAGLTRLSMAVLPTPDYATLAFILGFFALIFVLEMYHPRFWCRVCCPAGALLGCLGAKAALRRSAGPGCTNCGRCVRACPVAEAGGTNVRPADPAECLLCRRCVDACPEGAVRFGRVASALPPKPVDPGRRRALAVLAAGTGMGLASGLPLPAGAAVVRPPAALPEDDFLARCIRCGACAAACPTNTLQPVWFAAGVLGLFSPRVTPAIRFCEPRCHACAQACPSGAVRRIPMEERAAVKIGTAKVERKLCLAWEQRRKCLVCDEACPYDAVELREEQGNPVRVPFVDETKFAGCGYCEHHCPAKSEAGQKAIAVTPEGAVRLTEGSYAAEAGRRGLRLSLAPQQPQPGGYPAPGVDGANTTGGNGEGGASGGLPPGFSE